MRFVHFFVLYACKKHSPSKSENEGSKPVLASVEINLTPPRRPYPQLSAEIKSLERRRKRILTQQYKNLTEAFEGELKRAQTVIPKVVAYFFETFDDPTVVTRLRPTSFIEVGEIDVEAIENAGMIHPEAGVRVRALEVYREEYANRSHIVVLLPSGNLN